MRQKEVLLIIPAYNEEKNIEKVMKQLAQPEIADIVDVLVMNDASSDNTNWLAKEYGCAVVTHVFNLEYGSGLQLGYKYAIRRGYSYVIQIDADGQHDVCNIPKIYQRLQSLKFPLQKKWHLSCFEKCCIWQLDGKLRIRQPDCRV